MRIVARIAVSAGACVVLAVAPLGVAASAASGAVGQPVVASVGIAPEEPADPPSVTISSPDTSDCPQRSLPPAPVDTSENVPPGATSPAPLPVPAVPVGGKALGDCGFALPAGSPSLPSDISAAAWLVADLDSGEVLGAKDAHGRYRPASTLKLLTALVMLRQLKLDAKVEGASADTEQEGSRVGIGPGGKYTVRQLLMFLMMGSGNDVANALARANGGYDKTVADMNAAAESLGALDTRAATVSGLDGPGQMSSAYDMALFASAVMAEPEFAEIIATQYSKVPGWGPHEEFGIANDNQLLFNYPGAIGGKTGFTDDAGNTYVGMAERDGRRLVVTMLAGTQQPRKQWMQAASLLDWGFSVKSGTPAVGALAGSPAEKALAPAPSPTPSMPAPSRPPAAGAAGSPSSAAVSSAPNPSPGLAADTGSPAALPVLAGVAGLLAAGAAAFALVRRRRTTPAASADHTDQ